MSAPKGVECSKCYFFQPRDPRNEDAGECRFEAPLLRVPGYAVWPRVQPSDWCGKFRYQEDWPDRLVPNKKNN